MGGSGKGGTVGTEPPSPRLPVIGESTEGWVGRDRRSGEGNGFLEEEVAVLSKFWESVIGVAGTKFACHRPSVNWADGLHSE